MLVDVIRKSNEAELTRIVKRQVDSRFQKIRSAYNEYGAHSKFLLNTV